MVGGTGLALLIAPQLLRRVAGGDVSWRQSSFDEKRAPIDLGGYGLRRLATKLGRWSHWEFCPAWMFYPPVALYYFSLAVKYRSFTLPTPANPAIFSGGIIGQSQTATPHS